MIQRFIVASYQQAKKAVVIVVGFTILIIGIVMIALPGPGILVIPIGLAILATEFLWAKRLLRRFKKTVGHATKTPRNFKRLFLFAKMKVIRLFTKNKQEETSSPL
ncbi:MAG: PGPGW domain-containing protein [Nitrospirota bacterium]